MRVDEVLVDLRDPRVRWGTFLMPRSMASAMNCLAVVTFSGVGTTPLSPSLSFRNVKYVVSWTAPRIATHQPPAHRSEHASQHRSDGGEERRQSREQAQREASSLQRPHRTGDRDRRRQHDCGRQTLHDPGRQQPGQVHRQAGRHRGHGEDDGSDEERPLQAEPVTQTTAEDQKGRQRQDVGRQDPLTQGQRTVEVAHDLGDGHRHGRLVDQDHAPSERHRGQRHHTGHEASPT